MEDDMNDVHRYDDIIDLPHHISEAHPQMAAIDRAAQFSPFAALTGYEEAIKETRRLTDRRIELDEAEKTALDEKLRIVHEKLNSRPEVEITYFRPDDKKTGGTYISIIGVVKKIDRYERVIAMQDGTRIPIEEIIRISGELFRTMDDFLADLEEWRGKLI